MSRNSTIETILDGVNSSVSDAAKSALDLSIQNVTKGIEAATMNRSSNDMSKKRSFDKKKPTTVTSSTTLDAQVYTNLADMLNNSKYSDVAGLGTTMENLYARNKKAFSIIKDYELMPILIPQINRVLMFLVNECLSPDIQNDATFTISYIGSEDDNQLQKEIDRIKKDMLLDNLLRDVYYNRYKLGKEYIRVTDYSETFNFMMKILEERNMINESATSESISEYLDTCYSSLTETIDVIETSIIVSTTDVQSGSPISENANEPSKVNITESPYKLSFSDLNIQIEKSSIAHDITGMYGELISETYQNYSRKNIIRNLTHRGAFSGSALNEAVVDSSKFSQVLESLKKKKIKRCTVERLDPAKVFKLKVGGKIIGYMYLTDIAEGNSSRMVNFAQSLKDQLLKSRATNLGVAQANAEEMISKELAEKIINKFDPTIGVNRIEDIDLLHDYIKSNELYKGNKKIIFYYPDEIFDMSRADDSILINAVFFTKLYATLLLNNIITKVLRGRGRQFHTVMTGVSENVQRYIQNAMAALTMPENNLGTLHGSFEQLLNPFYGASDIVFPSEDGTDQYIRTDFIPGQDVNMDDEFLRMLLNSIVSSFGLDSAILDVVNGNVQFAKTLTMESLQIGTLIRNEQQDLHDPWENMCLEVLYINGSDELRTAINQEKVTVQFFRPKSLILQVLSDEINNAKTHAESVADIIPSFNQDGMESQRNRFVYLMVKKWVNLDWSMIDTVLKDIGIEAVMDEVDKEIQTEIQKLKDNIKEQRYGDTNHDGLVTDEDSMESSESSERYGEFADMGEDDTDLTPEEEELMNEPNP